MEDVKQLISIQEDRYSKINKALSNFYKTPKTRISLNYLNTRLESLESIRKSFINTHEQIISCVNKKDMTSFEYFKNDVYDQAEELYFTYKSELKGKISELTPQELLQPTSSNTKGNTSTSNNAEIKLPTIKLPSFSGKYTEWPSFCDLFTSIVHNNKNLDNVQKLHYLKSSLTSN